MRTLTTFLVLLVLGIPEKAWTYAPQSQNTQEEDAFKSNVNLVSVYFTVRDDKKRLASELGQDHFRVLEDGRERPIKFFAHHTDVVLNVGVLLDTGTGMAGLLNQEADASEMFLKHVVRPKDLGFAMSYHARVDTLQVPTADTALLAQSIDEIRRTASSLAATGPDPSAPLPGGGRGPTGIPYNARREAHLYDAVRVSVIRYLKNEIGRKAVVIVALSGDSKSESTLEDALDVLLANDVIAYVLQIYDAPHHPDYCDVRHEYGQDEHGEELLKKLAEATGGRMLEVRGPDKIQAALDEISEELHHQYSLGYTPANQDWDGKFRKLQINAVDKGYRVFARKGYYASPRR